MKTYQAKSVVTLNAGKVKLDIGQYLRRRHALKKSGDDVYAILQPIQFKVGELFSFDGDVPKGMAEDLGELDGEAATAAKTARDDQENKRQEAIAAKQREEEADRANLYADRQRAAGKKISAKKPE